MKQLTPHDRVGNQHEKPPPFDIYGVRVGRIGRAHEFGPMIPNGLFGGIVADLIFDHQFIDKLGEVLRRPFFLSAGLVKRHATQIPD